MQLARPREAQMTPNILQIRSRAFEIIKERSLVLGKVTLSSGKESDHYFDMKTTMLHPEGSNLLCELILNRIASLDVDYIGGLEMGAVPLIGPLAAISWQKGKPIQGFFVRKEPKEHGTQKQIEAVDDLQGKNVVIIDDVTTTGQSAMKSIEILKNAGAKVVLVLSILDRQEGAAELYKAGGIPFQSLFTAEDFIGSRNS